MRSFVLVPLVFLPLSGCGPSRPPDDLSAATAAVMMEIRPGTPLEDMLATLDGHLVNAITDQLADEGIAEFQRAEAITDRLLEARMPFEWISDEQYSLESRLRQIQSGADRVLAQIRVGAPRPQTLEGLRMLRTDVARLRQTIAKGGGPAPTPIQDLLADTIHMPVAAPATATPDDPAQRRQPLGTPVIP